MQFVEELHLRQGEEEPQKENEDMKVDSCTQEVHDLTWLFAWY